MQLVQNLLRNALVAGDLPIIEVDVDRVQQVFSNLLSNALEFCDPGGYIELDTRCSGDGLRFSVRDTGPGISARNLPYLFNRFVLPTRPQ